MTQLRQRMTDDMTVRGLAENTKKSYLNSVAGLARHYRRRPDRISAPEVQDYLLHCGGDVADALMVAVVIVMIDEDTDELSRVPRRGVLPAGCSQ